MSISSPVADAREPRVRLVALRPELLPGASRPSPQTWVRAASVSCAVAGLVTVFWFQRSPQERARFVKPRPVTSGVATLSTAPSQGTGPAESSDATPPPLQLQKLSPAEALLINAGTPVSTAPIQPAAPFRAAAAAGAEDYARARDCLTAAVYYEAALEGRDGQRAVAQVVLNRVRHPAYPKSVCGVVYQGKDLPTGCQFTFTCDGSMQRKPAPRLWQRAQDVAEKALNGDVMPAVGTATHYHTVFVVPYWSPSLVKLARIGAHIFYRWVGSNGLVSAFQGRYSGQELDPSAAPIADPAAAAPEATITAPAPVLSTQATSVVIHASEREEPLAAPLPIAHAAKMDLAVPAPPTVTPAPAAVSNGETRSRPRLAIPESW